MWYDFLYRPNAEHTRALAVHAQTYGMTLPKLDEGRSLLHSCPLSGSRALGHRFYKAADFSLNMLADIAVHFEYSLKKVDEDARQPASSAVGFQHFCPMIRRLHSVSGTRVMRYTGSRAQYRGHATPMSACCEMSPCCPEYP